MAGGWRGSGRLSSTEIYEAGQWTEVGALPAAVYGLSGASVQNTVYMMGKRRVVTHMLLKFTDTEHALIGGYDRDGYDRDDILKYDADAWKWEKVGRMLHARRDHAVSTIANKDLAKYCNN